MEPEFGKDSPTEKVPGRNAAPDKKGVAGGGDSPTEQLPVQRAGTESAAADGDSPTEQIPAQSAKGSPSSPGTPRRSRISSPICST